MCQELQELQLCWVFQAQQFPLCIKNGPPPKRHPANLTQLWKALKSTWVRIPEDSFQHLVESIPPAQLVEYSACNAKLVYSIPGNTSNAYALNKSKWHIMYILLKQYGTSGVYGQYPRFRAVLMHDAMWRAKIQPLAVVYWPYTTNPRGALLLL